MASNVALFRTVVNDIGYRFALPLSLPPPPPGGDLVDVEVAVFFKDTTEAILKGHPANAAATRRAPSLDYPTVDIALAGAVWHLPLFGEPDDEGEDNLFRLQVRRMLPRTRLLGLDAPSAAAAFQPSSPINDKELGINMAYDEDVQHTQYVDVLPKGDPPCTAAAQRLVNSTHWAVSMHLSTWFRLTIVDKVKRNLDLLALKSNGLPCTVKGKGLSITGKGFKARNLKMTCTSLADGDGRLLLIPIANDYACQPAAASAEASYILNNFQIVVEQGGRRHRAYEPVRKQVNRAWRELFRVFTEYISAESASSFLYSEIFDWDEGEDDIAGFGVRLRDGGARLPLRTRTSDGEAMQLRLPCNAAGYVRYGTFSGSVAAEDMDNDVVVDVCLFPNIEPVDIVLKARERIDGAYDDILYALRHRNDFSSINEGGWMIFDSSIIEPAAIRFMANAARMSFGREWLRPTPCFLGPGSSCESSVDGEEDHREDKKPRLS